MLESLQNYFLGLVWVISSCWTILEPKVAWVDSSLKIVVFWEVQCYAHGLEALIGSRSESVRRLRLLSPRHQHHSLLVTFYHLTHLLLEQVQLDPKVSANICLVVPFLDI